MCTSRRRDIGSGIFQCLFVHDYPARLHRHGHGSMDLTVAPADRPGWYVASFGDCG